MTITLAEEQEILSYIDALFPYFKEQGSFNLASVINSSNIANKNRANKLREEIEYYLCLKTKYTTSGTGDCELTKKGRAAKAAGGHYAYQKHLKLSAIAQEEKEFLHIKNALLHFIKTNNYRLLIAIILLIMVVLAIIKLIR